MTHIETGLVTKEQRLGNHFADHLAGLGAGLNAMTPAELGKINKADQRAWLVLKRIVAVYSELLPEVPPFKKKPRIPLEKIPRTPLETLIKDSTHQVQKLGLTHHRYQCTVCLEAPPRESLRRWLATPCAGKQGMDSNHPLPDPLIGPIYVGTTALHYTHLLSRFKGVLFCHKCGSFARSHPLKLRQPCKRYRTPAGKDVLARLHGEPPLPPRSLKGWPEGGPCAPQAPEDRDARADFARWMRKRKHHLAHDTARLDSIPPLLAIEDGIPPDSGDGAFGPSAPTTKRLRTYSP